MPNRRYLAFSYQYNDMPSPKVNAYPYWDAGSRKTLLDCLPPTVIHLRDIEAPSKPEAIRIFKKTEAATDA